MIHDETLSIPDAMHALTLLAEWNPPEGIATTVSMSRHPVAPDRRRVTMTMTPDGESVVIVVIERVPIADDFDNLWIKGKELLAEAWDQPACSGLGACGCQGDSPAYGHPIFDTTDMGKDS